MPKAPRRVTSKGGKTTSFLVRAKEESSNQIRDKRDGESDEPGVVIQIHPERSDGFAGNGFDLGEEAGQTGQYRENQRDQRRDAEAATLP